MFILRFDTFNETPVFMAYKAIEGMVASRDMLSMLNLDRRTRFVATLGACMVQFHGRSAGPLLKTQHPITFRTISAHLV